MTFNYDAVPTFAIGTGDAFQSWGEASSPDRRFRGHDPLSIELVEGLVTADFDVLRVDEMRIDHAFATPLGLFWGRGLAGGSHLRELHDDAAAEPRSLPRLRSGAWRRAAKRRMPLTASPFSAPAALVIGSACRARATSTRLRSGFSRSLRGRRRIRPRST